jgi:hypothetical protein
MNRQVRPLTHGKMVTMSIQTITPEQALAALGAPIHTHRPAKALHHHVGEGLSRTHDPRIEAIKQILWAPAPPGENKPIEIMQKDDPAEARALVPVLQAALDRWGAGHLWRAYEEPLTVRDERGRPWRTRGLFIMRRTTAPAGWTSPVPT